MRPASIHRYHATCLNMYGVVSRNWSQYQLVSRQVAVSRRSPYTMIPCNWDWGKYQRVWGGLETISNSLAAGLLWITTKWIPIASFWRNLLIFIVCTLRRYQFVSAWYRDTSLMKPRHRDRSPSIWPSLDSLWLKWHWSKFLSTFLLVTSADHHSTIILISHCIWGVR
jgi:hypothetical protein